MVKYILEIFTPQLNHKKLVIENASICKCAARAITLEVMG